MTSGRFFSLVVLVGLISVFVPSVVGAERVLYVTTDEEILQKELDWAEKSLESYKRLNGRIPLRSSIDASHVHTDQWKNDSVNVVRGTSSIKGNLRGQPNDFAYI